MSTLSGIRDPDHTPASALVPDRLRRSLAFLFGAEGTRFADALPTEVRDHCRRWSLELRATASSTTAFVAHVVAAGRPAVLKITHPALTGEALALLAYGPRRAVRVLRVGARAVLLESVAPATPLADEPVPTMLDVTAALAEDLWSVTPVPGIPSLAERCDAHATSSEQHLGPDADDDVVAGLALLRSLPRSASTRVLLHGDLDPANVLRSARAGWLVADANPTVGDPAYEAMPLVLRSWRAAPETARAPLLLDVAGRLGLDAPRVAAWGWARRADWSVFSGARGGADAARARSEMRSFADICRALGGPGPAVDPERRRGGA